MKRVVLAYSGGLVPSAAIGWLAETCGAEVVTVTLDLGQGRELAAVRERALALGAVRAHVVDAREEFVRDYLLPALQAGSLRDGHALTRPLIARRLLDLARMEGASAVAHGGESGTAAEAALRTALRSIDPDIEIIAPAREWGMSAEALGAYARARGVPAASPFRHRIDASVWGRVVTSDAAASIPDEVFTLTRAPEECPDEAALVEVEFSSGVPVRANGVEMPMVELIESLEIIAGAHGVGRIRTNDAVIEAPAATVLDAAHRELEAFVVGADLARLKGQLSRVYSEAMLNGRWFSDTRAAIDAFAGVIQPRVTGTVRLRLLAGQCMVVNRASVNAAPAPGATGRSKVVA